MADSAERISQVEWSVYGKILCITKRSPAVGEVERISYTYDPSGNRISKRVESRQRPDNLSWYVRDAQGNVMAVYTRSGNNAQSPLILSETHLYGSSRLGLVQRSLDMGQPVATTEAIPLLGSGKGDNFTRGQKIFELTNHLGNVLAVVSDRKTGVDGNADGLIDHYIPDITSAQDYYAFGMIMPGRKYSSGSVYRYSINGQEKENELNENITSAEFWMYDSRIGRRWNIDPIDLHIQSVYVTFNNNAIFYVDPKGLYSTKKKAERMHNRALKAGRDVGEVRYSEKQKDWVFDELKVEVTSNSDGTNETIVTSTVFANRRYFGDASQKISDFFNDINPVESVEGYLGGLVKTEISIKNNAKVVVPYGGFQLKANFKEGNLVGDASIVDGRLSYLNIKVGNADFRVLPINQIGGDYDPGVRLLYTMISRPIVIPVGDIPVPIGEAKLQGDFQMSSSKTTIGMRGAAETFSFPSFRKGKSGIKLELNAGVRFELKIPDLFKD